MKFLGIDWATDVHYLALIAEDGAILDEWTVNHTPAAVAALLRRLAEEGGPQQISVAVESGAPLVTDQLLEADYKVYPINPKQADRFRDRHCPTGAKDDRRDAWVLGDALRTDAGRLTPLEKENPLVEELRLRDRARTRLVAHRTQLSNQLGQVLARYYPALLELKRSMRDPFLLALLRSYPDAEQGRRARVRRLQALVESHRLRKIDAEVLKSLLRGPVFVVPGHVAAACRDEALDLADQIEMLNEKIAAAETRLKELFERHPDRELLKSLPGLGDTLAIRVAGELGQHRVHRVDATTFQALAGTAPVTRRSGKRGLLTVTMRKSCNRVLQSALFNMARASVCRSEWAKAFDDDQCQRRVRRASAVRTLSNKWAKILWAVLSTRRPYDEALHLSHLQRNGVPWAKALVTPAEKAA